MKFDKNIVIDQITDMLKEHEDYKNQSQYSDFSDLDDAQEIFKFVSRGLALIERIVGTNHTYWKKAQYEIETYEPKDNIWQQIFIVAGILEALQNDIKSGLLTSYRELIHADIFADFLEMADYLLSEGYKDAAAVMIGGVLEGHIRKLCIKNKISLVFEKENGDQIPKKLDRMNSDLAKKEIYTKLDQKSITSWSGLRNDAAHGNYEIYSIKQVRLMSGGVTDFMIRNPA